MLFISVDIFWKKMEIRWSPRKRIKLGEGHSDENLPRPVPLPDQATVDKVVSSVSGARTHSVKRTSTDFNKELDECLDLSVTAFRPTQVFLVDPDMELAMLRVDMDLQSSISTPHELPKPSQTRSLCRWGTAPLFDSTNSIGSSLTANLKRHISDSSFHPMLPQPTTQETVLVDDLEGIDIAELTALVDNAERSYALQTLVSTQECTQPTTTRMFSCRCKVVEIPVSLPDGVGVRVVEESTGAARLVILKGVWKDAYLEDPWQIKEGDILHLLAGSGKQWESGGFVILGDSENLFPDILVVHPDFVISSTALSGSANCHRRSVIQNRVIAPQIGPAPTEEGDVARAISPIVGNCVHEAIQAATAANDFSEEFILAAGTKALNEMMLPAVWLAGAQPGTILNQLRNRLPSMREWGLCVWPKIGKRLLGCEVDVRPKSMGVSGKLDMDIEDLDGARSCVEIKTGKQHAIHVGQVVLYYLLQFVHANEPLPFSGPDSSVPQTTSQKYFLLYLPASAPATTLPVSISARECQNIMRNRNLIASHNVRNTLPPPIEKPFECAFCPVRRECASYLEFGGSDEFFKNLQLAKRGKQTVFVNRCVEYQRKWLGWISAQPMDKLGGLSAVRRMRGNLLNLTAHAILKGTGKFADEQIPFRDWMPTFLQEGRSKAETVDEKFILDRILTILHRGRQRMLICGIEHESIDKVLTALLPLLSDEIRKRVTRIASKIEDVAEDIRPHVLPQEWPQRADEIDKSQLLFACTVKGVHHDILSKGEFAFALVLDAEKVPDPALWGVALRVKRLLLVASGASADENNTLYHRISKDEETQEPTRVVKLD